MLSINNISNIFSKIKGFCKDVSSSTLYTAYKVWFKNNYHNKKPSSIQEFSYKMKEIDLVAQQMRKNGTRKMRYQISRTSLYNTYMKKGWLDSLENIKEPANDNVNSVIQSIPENVTESIIT